MCIRDRYLFRNILVMVFVMANLMIRRSVVRMVVIVPKRIWCFKNDGPQNKERKKDEPLAVKKSTISWGSYSVNVV